MATSSGARRHSRGCLSVGQAPGPAGHRLAEAPGCADGLGAAPASTRPQNREWAWTQKAELCAGPTGKHQSHHCTSASAACVRSRHKRNLQKSELHFGISPSQLTRQRCTLSGWRADSRRVGAPSAADALSLGPCARFQASSSRLSFLLLQTTGRGGPCPEPRLPASLWPPLAITGIWGVKLQVGACLQNFFKNFKKYKKRHLTCIILGTETRS